MYDEREGNGRRRSRVGLARLVVWMTVGLLVSSAPGASNPPTEHAEADVVVLVDTSASMRQSGMDPERTSLLVTQLLADIVPGELAAVRLLDLADDQDLLPRRETGRSEPCQEDPTQLCSVVEPASDWHDGARRLGHGVLDRPRRGDDDYASRLESHLAQNIDNSLFDLAFRAAQGVFERHVDTGRDLPKTVIWLSDGKTDDPLATLAAIRDLTAAEVAIEAIVFGQGDTAFAERAGLPTRRVSGPAELMRAFAGAFRRVVGAPYEIDARLADAPSFTIQPAVDEAWVVVYGDDELTEAWLEAPDGELLAADHAGRRWRGAGAYRVAHLRRPAPGSYGVRATGGGGDTAYAVVQRSSLAPRLIEPTEAIAGVDTPLVAEVVAGREGSQVTDAGVLAAAAIDVQTVGGVTLVGSADGALTRRDDGRFVGTVRFDSVGPTRVRLRLESPVVERVVDATVEVSGFWRPTRPDVEVALGTSAAGETACRPLPIEAEHQGTVPIVVDASGRLPTEHELFLRAGDDVWAMGTVRLLAPGEAVEVCLHAGERAPSSTSAMRPWLKLSAVGGNETLVVHLSWTLEGLGFWARWGWLILLLVAVLLVVFVIAGFVVPHRFPPSLALTFVDDRDEVEEQQPQPIRQWKGVGIGFYRDARAHLHTSFRVTGKARGALATLVAERGGARVLAGKGGALYRETLDGDWEAVAEAGRRVRGGDTYRVGEAGPYFRVAFRRGGGG